MTNPFFVDIDAALKMRRDTAASAYAWRKKNVTDPFTRLGNDAVERADPVDEAFCRWLIDEMARGTEVHVLGAALGVLVDGFMSTLDLSVGVSEERFVAVFLASLQQMHHDSDVRFSGAVPGVEGGRA